MSLQTPELEEAPVAGLPVRTAEGIREAYGGRHVDGGLTVRRLLLAAIRPVFVVNLGVVAGLFAATGGFAHHESANDLTMIAGRLSAIIATNLILIQLLLIGRNQWLDRLAGLDRLARWHARLGRWSFSLLALHFVAIVVGYADNKVEKIISELVDVVWNTRDVLMATVAFACFCAVAITSVRMARRRLKYQTWHFVHLYAYLGVALALPHQIYTGSHFVEGPVAKVYWVTLYTLCVGSLIWFRAVRPILRSVKHRLHVLEVVDEGNSVASVYVAGRDLHQLGARPGQFFIWRFLDKDRWWEAHPYSLSSAPHGDFFRVSVKALGDSSSELVKLKRGTKVVAEGPFGAFTAESRTRRKVVLVAGGIGITPIRALAETFPARHGDITLIYRVRTRSDAMFMDELRSIAVERGIQIHLISDDDATAVDRAPLSPRHLLALVPDVAEHDVFICGPPKMTEVVVANLRSLGLSGDQIHFERFEL